MNALAVLVVAGGLTYLLRSSLVFALAGRALPRRATLALSAVVPAGLAALIVSSVAASGPSSPSIARLAAVGVAVGVARVTRRMAPTVAAGMVALWLLTAAGA